MASTLRPMTNGSPCWLVSICWLHLTPSTTRYWSNACNSSSESPTYRWSSCGPISSTEHSSLRWDNIVPTLSLLTSLFHRDRCSAVAVCCLLQPSGWHHLAARRQVPPVCRWHPAPSVCACWQHCRGSHCSHCLYHWRQTVVQQNSIEALHQNRNPLK